MRPHAESTRAEYFHAINIVQLGIVVDLWTNVRGAAETLIHLMTLGNGTPMGFIFSRGCSNGERGRCFVLQIVFLIAAFHTKIDLQNLHDGCICGRSSFGLFVSYALASKPLSFHKYYAPTSILSLVT